MENWFAPGFDSPRTSLLLCLVVVAMVAASLVWVRLPGPVTPAERVRRSPGRRLALRLAGLSALFGPLIMVFSVWSLAFPLRQPTVVTLITRSRPAGETSRELTEWKAKLRSELGTPRPWGSSDLDAGRLVDRVCQRLGRPRPGWTDTRSSDLAATVRREIRVAMSFQELATARVKDGSPGDFIQPESDHCRSNGLPRWLIESVEISVLRALAESVNVVELRLAGPQRKTAMGQAWEGLQESLESTSPRSRPPRIRMLSSLPEPSRLRIAAVLGPADAQGVVRCLIALPPDMKTETGVRFLLRSSRTGAVEPSASVSLTADPEGRLIAAEARFAALPAGSRWQISIEGTDIWHPVVRSSKGVRSVLVRAPEELRQRWIETARVLLSSPSANPAIVEWRRFRKLYGLDREVQFLTSERSAGGWDTVLDASLDHAVAVYPNGAMPKIKSMETGVEMPIVRGRVTRNALPGVYSLDALPLVPGVFSQLRLDREERCDAVLTRRVAPKFSQGLLNASTEPQSLVTMRQMDRGWLTYIGFRFDRQGMLLGTDGRPVAGEPFDTARLFAGWTQLLAAIEQAHATTAGCEPPAQIADDPTHPVSFLDSAEQAAYHRDGTMGAVASFAVGLAVYGAWLVRGLRR